MAARLQNPSKPLVKNHQSLVLRAESASEKYAWLARLKFAADYAGNPGTPLRSYDSAQLLEQVGSLDAFSSWWAGM